MVSSLTDKMVKPTDEMLGLVLGAGKPLWDSVKAHIWATYQKPGEEWKFYGVKAGWTIAVFSGKRRLINMIPKIGYCEVIFTLGEKAAEIARNSDLPSDIKALIPDTTQCVCGYGLRLDLKTQDEVEVIKVLLEIKDKN